jgi:glycosyltransferase involved in cell wall biosynthesis
LLTNCLKSLGNQTLNKNDYQLIVVSDGDDVNTEKVVREFRAQHQHDIYYYALPSKQGPAAARNMGWEHAGGTLIAFTDDDCLPDTNWLTAIWDMYLGEDFVAYTGKVIVPVSEKPRDFELNTAGLETAEFVTANCVCTKKALIKTGGFDEQFKQAWREDSDLHFKLMLNRVPIYKNNKAVVVHPVRPAPWGISIKEQRKSMFNALLYKKYPHLYRQRIKPNPSWHYYGSVLFFVTAVAGFIFGAYDFALASLITWLGITIWFTGKRLSGATRSIDHVLEMFLTSMIIPFLSVYWTLYGAWKFKVLFL